LNGQIRNQPNLIPLFFHTDYKNRYKRRHIDASKPLTLAQSQSLDPLYSEDVADIHKEDRRVSDAPLTRMEANLLKDAFEEMLGSSRTQHGGHDPYAHTLVASPWGSEPCRRVSNPPLTRMEANLLKDAFEEILGSSQTQNGDQVPHTLATSVRAWRS
jgi:hypothetical protein